MTIFVKKLDGWTREIQVVGEESLDVVRQKVAIALGDFNLTAGQIQLIYRGKGIGEGRLQDYEVGSGDTLMVVIKEKRIIQITVVVGNRNIALEVEISELVDNVKQMLFEKEGYAIDQQILSFTDRQMDGGKLSHYGVCHGAVLQLSLRVIQIFVKSLDGKTFTFDVKFNDTVDHLQKLVQEKTGISPQQQRLDYGGKQLQKGHLLSKYGITANSTVHLNLRLRGGSLDYCSSR